MYELSQLQPVQQQHRLLIPQIKLRMRQLTWCLGHHRSKTATHKTSLHYQSDTTSRMGIDHGNRKGRDWGVVHGGGGVASPSPNQVRSKCVDALCKSLNPVTVTTISSSENTTSNKHQSYQHFL